LEHHLNSLTLFDTIARPASALGSSYSSSSSLVVSPNMSTGLLDASPLSRVGGLMEPLSVSSSLGIDSVLKDEPLPLVDPAALAAAAALLLNAVTNVTKTSSSVGPDMLAGSLLGPALNATGPFALSSTAPSFASTTHAFSNASIGAIPATSPLLSSGLTADADAILAAAAAKAAAILPLEPAIPLPINSMPIASAPVPAIDFVPRRAPVPRKTNNTAVQDSASGRPSSCVWVGNVDAAVSELEFTRLMEQFGVVKNVRMLPKSKCAFVTFGDAATALSSLALEGHMLGSLRLTLNVAMASRHLWVGNVAEAVTEGDLYAALGRFGAIESVRLLAKHRCAFVNFVREEDAMQACNIMNGSEVGGQKIVVNFQWTDAYKRPPPPSSAPYSQMMQRSSVEHAVTPRSEVERVQHRQHSRNHHHGRQARVGPGAVPAPSAYAHHSMPPRSQPYFAPHEYQNNMHPSFPYGGAAPFPFQNGPPMHTVHYYGHPSMTPSFGFAPHTQPRY
jgi:RNA recognition motif-containing protein